MDKPERTVEVLPDPDDETIAAMRVQGALFWQQMYLGSLRRYAQLYSHHIKEKRENAQWEFDKAITRLILGILMGLLAIIHGVTELWFPAADGVKIITGAMIFFIGSAILGLLAFEASVTFSELRKSEDQEAD